MDALAGRRFLVTGASGFVGGHVVAVLEGAGAVVHGLSRSGGPTSASVVHHAVDLVDAAGVERVVRQVDPEAVVHLGGFSQIGRSWDHVSECFRANVEGTADLLRSLRGGACERFVFVSTSDVYGDAPAPSPEDGPVNPLSPYALSKHTAEQLCLLERRADGTPVVVVRPFNAYGPGQPRDRLIPDVIASALRGDELRMTEARQRRDFVHVADVADGIVRAVTTPGIDGEVFNLGTGDDTAVRDVATTILTIMGDPVAPTFGVVPSRPNEVHRMCADTTKAAAMLGWRPARTLHDGLADTVAWYREHL
jgi:UDP-glucose 4-epimerase